MVVAVSSAGLFLGLARVAVTTPVDVFRRVTAVMATVAGLLVLLSPLAGVALVGAVLLSRALAVEPVPATVPELLERYRPPSS